MDGSSETKAHLIVYVNGTKNIDKEIAKSTDEDEKDDISAYSISTKDLKEGAVITWKVQTAGITGVYGDWSITRTIDIYAPPTLELKIKDSTKINEISVLESFPFYIEGIPGPKTQAPISYHVSIISNSSYETVDNVGNRKIVSEGDEVYSEYYDTTNDLLLELLPHSIDLENDVEYTVIAVVSMNSGLTAEAIKEFSVSWTDEIYTPDAEISYDEERYTTHIRPYCLDHSIELHSVTKDTDGKYSVSSTVVNYDTTDSVYTEDGEEVLLGLYNGNEIYYCRVMFDVDGNPIDTIYYIVENNSGVYKNTYESLNRHFLSEILTATGETVLMGTLEDGTQIYYSEVDKSTLVENVSLSVYRREYDGRFVEIGAGLNNESNTYVTDPHPALDYARYRVVAISNSTGAVSYYDVPGHPINEPAIIIQWDEDWNTYDTTEEAAMEQPAWTGSLVRLPYNVDVSEATNIDVATVDYIGRSHPVSYYGTQLGVTSSWSTVIDKQDKDTIYALRRLMIWMGDVYVREPSGVGYWATIKVSFGQTHCEPSVPVTLDITRVEGGV